MNPRTDIEIFCIDDNKSITDCLTVILENSGRTNFRMFNRSEDLLAALHERVYICIVDYWLKETINGLDLIKIVVKKNPHCFFIMLSAQKNLEVVLEFMNSVYGGRYIEKTDDLVIKLPEVLTDAEQHLCIIHEIYQNAHEQLQIIRKAKTILESDE